MWAWWQHIGGFFTQTAAMIGIWHLIKWLNSVLEPRMPFENGPLLRMFIQVSLTLFILSPVVITGLVVMGPYLPQFISKPFIAITLMLFVVVIFLFNFSFYASFFFQNWQQSVEEKASLAVQAAQLEKEKSLIQYNQLKNQVNPHFLFNTLSSLDGLIHTNPDLASDFLRHMSKVYRYVLQHKENELVLLDEELSFIKHYIQLLNIRYGDALQVQLNISDAAKDKYIVIVALQVLIDNAIKHNTTQASSPLKIIIWDEYDYLIVYNNKQLRKQIETSNKQGLNQMKELYAYIIDKAVLIEDNHEHFTIKIPLL
jgi:hypothetical protein